MTTPLMSSVVLCASLCLSVASNRTRGKRRVSATNHQDDFTDLTGLTGFYLFIVLSPSPFSPGPSASCDL
jgi:hypothetical protein